MGSPASGQFGKLAVTGQAALNGTLTVTVVNGYTLVSRDEYRVLTFASRTGDFPTPPDGFDLRHDSTSLTLIVQ